MVPLVSSIWVSFYLERDGIAFWNRKSKIFVHMLNFGLDLVQVNGKPTTHPYLRLFHISVQFLARKLVILSRASCAKALSVSVCQIGREKDTRCESKHYINY